MQDVDGAGNDEREKCESDYRLTAHQRGTDDGYPSVRARNGTQQTTPASALIAFDDLFDGSQRSHMLSYPLERLVNRTTARRRLA